MEIIYDRFKQYKKVIITIQIVLFCYQKLLNEIKQINPSNDSISHEE